MDLNIYDIIRGPRVTEKTYYLNNKYKQLVLRVHPKANKSQIKKAIEKLFNVKVKNVRVICSEGKVYRVGRRFVQGKDSKKAVITLMPGFEMNMMGSQVVQNTHAAPAEKNIE